tara:strand:+ start:2247 stop:2744 length:498 start_codon:yes stop_codon:yes gene_type:complete
MASLSFKIKKGDNSDNHYFTPPEAWKDIDKYIPKSKNIWEAFYNSSSPSPDALRELGCKEVISVDEDFFKVDYGDVIISNPPYSMKKKVFERLKALNKPFILIVPISIISKKFYKDTGFHKCGIIVPKRRIHFIKGKEPTKRSWFDVIYLCFQIDGVREKEIIYL